MKSKFSHISRQIVKISLITQVLIGMLSSFGFAQQSALYSQYVFSPLVINPAYAGNQDQLQITTLHRRQWDNFAGAPTTSTLAAHQSVKQKNIGLGMVVSNDKIGVHSNQRLYVMYAYKIRLTRGTLSMGIQGGFSRLQSDFSELNLRNDDQLVSGLRNTFSPNFGTGVYYHTSSFFAGLSVPYLLNNSLNSGLEGLAEGKEKRYYFLTAGKVVAVSDMVKMLPSALIRVQEGNASSLELGVDLILDDVLTVGARYRSEDALISVFKLAISDNLSLGYSYDHTLSDIGQYSDGSHEFMLNYRLPFAKKCQTYF